MSEQLPHFRYHPRAVSNGAIKPSDQQCDCCGQQRGWIYEGSFYTAEGVDRVCAWCIADGSAAKKFDGEFSDTYPLEDDGIAPEIIDEVCRRTPGYVSWQQEVWLSHCNDACCFIGDATIADVKSASVETRDAWKSAFEMADDDWDRLVARYGASDDVLYKFSCRHCQMTLFGWDSA